MENCSYFFMFMGYIFTASLLIFIFLLLPLWYIGRNNAEKRKTGDGANDYLDTGYNPTDECNEKYDNVECIYFFCAETEEKALINWAKPETF